MLKNFYQLTKPGIVWSNALTAAAGFALASHSNFNWLLLVMMLVGLSCIISSACVFNNYADRAIDAKMERTKTRPSIHALSGSSILIFGTLLGLIGIGILWQFTTTLAMSFAIAGFGIYVFLYTPFKPRTPHALWIGALAGATPPVVGYVTLTNQFDLIALSLFLFLFFWQIPHFLAIGSYRYDDYAQAGVPLLVHKPSDAGRRTARKVFFGSLGVLLLWCGTLFAI